MPTPLPKVDSPQVQRIANEDPNYLSAYNVCLRYEQELAGFTDKLRHVRILGFWLLHAPTRGVRAEVAKCIHSRKDNSDLAGVGAFFERNVIMSFKKYRGPTPEPSERSSRSSFENVKAQAKVDITQAPKSHEDAKERALIRDDWSCVVTGVIDSRAPSNIVAQLDPDIIVVNTELAHIIPQGIFFSVEPKSGENAELDYSASILAVLKRFCYNISVFNGEQVHSLTNVITLEYNIYDKFDCLELYFDATPQKDHYEIKWYGVGKPHPHIRRFVMLSTPDPENLPVPLPDLLALHAMCCKVAHLSGSAEYIDAMYRDADRMDVLLADSSSGDVLHHMLMSLSNSAVGVRS